MKKWVYLFKEGNADMRELLGGKGANLAEMTFFGANLTGQGRTYWTEDNTASEPFYMLLGAHAGVQLGDMTINIWGKNLTDKSYVPFYFVSMSNGFAQTCRPRQFGIDLTYHF